MKYEWLQNLNHLDLENEIKKFFWILYIEFIFICKRSLHRQALKTVICYACILEENICSSWTPFFILSSLRSSPLKWCHISIKTSHYTSLSIFGITTKKPQQLCITAILCWESTDNWWIPCTKGQYCGKCVYVMNSSSPYNDFQFLAINILYDFSRNPKSHYFLYHKSSDPWQPH